MVQVHRRWHRPFDGRVNRRFCQQFVGVVVSAGCVRMMREHRRLRSLGTHNSHIRCETRPFACMACMSHASFHDAGIIPWCRERHHPVLGKMAESSRFSSLHHGRNPTSWGNFRTVRAVIDDGLYYRDSESLANAGCEDSTRRVCHVPHAGSPVKAETEPM